ncbi:MAG TPA: hypothetical protein VMZ26_07740 [Pyrinomonadaceae bacterium]|nr:hypothetical protein [Pyrinomonadaceae bacterium]
MTKKTPFLPFAIIALVTVVGCGRFRQQAGNDSEPKPASDQPSNAFTLAGKEWKTFVLDQTDISVDLPGQPSDKTPPDSRLPAGTKEVFSSMRIHSYDDKDFASSYTQLVPTGKRKFEIKELADTSMAALKRQAPDLNYTLDTKSPTNAKYDGTFTRNGKNYELKGCCVFQKTNPSRVWAVITLYPKDSADGRTASQRIIESATFKDSTEKCN